MWQPTISGDLAVWTAQVVRDVSKRLSDPQLVEQAAAACVTQTAFPKAIHWLPYSVAQGYAGLAFLCGYLDSCLPGEGWDVVGRQNVERAARDAEAYQHIPLGSFSGLSGLGLAVWQLSREGTRYRRLLASIDAALVPQVFQLADNVRAQKHGVNIGDFDAISGLSGIGSYLLLRRSEPPVAGALATVIEALVELISENRELPRWHTPKHLLWDDDLLKSYPHGNLNCGLAHGVPSIVAFLSICLNLGIGSSGLKEAVEQSAGWLVSHRCDDHWGVNWPTAVPVVEVDTPEGVKLTSGSGVGAPDGPTRAAWCYGSPGVARSLWLAGDALNDDALRRLSVSAMEAVFRRPVPARRIDSPTFCHGKAGLLQIALRFANDTGCESFKLESQTLVREILHAYDPQSLLGFRNTETVDHEIDQPGLLDGAPGVVLALLAASTSSVPPDWDRLFLLS